MNLYVYAPELYPGTRELIQRLQAKRLVMHDGMRFLYRGVPVEFGASDVVVCWGAHVPPVEGVHMLNASYKHTNQLGINLQLSKYARASSHTAFDLMTMRNADYELDRTAYEAWKAGSKKKRFASRSGIVPSKEFYGYGTRHYTFNRMFRVEMFGQQCLTKDARSEDVVVAQAVIKSLHLDFVRLSFGVVGDVYVLLKVITAPALDSEGVEKYASLITESISKVLGQAKLLEDMRKALEE